MEIKEFTVSRSRTVASRLTFDERSKFENHKPMVSLTFSVQPDEDWLECVRHGNEIADALIEEEVIKIKRKESTAQPPEERRALSPVSGGDAQQGRITNCPF